MFLVSFVLISGKIFIYRIFIFLLFKKHSFLNVPGIAPFSSKYFLMALLHVLLASSATGVDMFDLTRDSFLHQQGEQV